MTAAERTERSRSGAGTGGLTGGLPGFVPEEEERYLPVITRRFSGLIALPDIIMIRRDGHCFRIILENREYRMYCRREELERYLDDRFCLMVAGWYINFGQVSHMEQGTVWFRDGSLAVPGRDAYIRTRQRFNIYIREYTGVLQRTGQFLRGTGSAALSDRGHSRS